MSRIDVVSDGKRTKIMVNFIKRADYSSPLLANNEATKLKNHQYPTYNLNLASVTV